MTRTSLTTVIFDVDGTLIDSNAAHAETWAEALRESGFDVDADRVRPLIGMGGDKLLPALVGIAADSDRGNALGRRKKQLFADRVPHLRPTRGARDLVAFLRKTNIDVAVATSSDRKDMQTLLVQAGVADLIPDRASKDDAARSKPDPDIVKAALDEAHARPEDAVLVGDTPYDVEAAARAGVTAIALRCGGHWPDDAFAGAAGILDDPAALYDEFRRWLDGSLRGVR